MATLLSAHTASSSGTAVSLPIYRPGPDAPGLYTISAWGTFDGCTIQIEVSPDGTEWINVSGLSFTAEGVQNLEVFAHSVKATVSSAGASTSVSASIQ